MEKSKHHHEETEHEHDHCGCHGHCHEHHHEHEHSLREQIVKIAVTVILLVAAVLIEKHTALTTWQLLLVYLVPYLLIGWDTLKEAAEGLGTVRPSTSTF